MKKGVPVSPGVAVARAFVLDDSLARREPHHLEDAVKALTVKLDADELKYLSELYKPRSVLANM